MRARNVLYAAVGAPVMAARRMSDQVEALRAKVNEETSGYAEAAEKAFDEWAAEGEKLVSRISEGAVVEEISSKMDLDQAKEQVSKLRDQLEDMLATWRTSFRPEEKTEVTGKAGSTKPATKTEATTKPTAKTSTAKKPAAKTSTAKKPAAKTSTAKKPAAKPSSTAKATKAS